MFECRIEICIKESKFHVFSPKIRKKVENQEHLMFECWIEIYIKESKFQVFFRENRMSCIFNFIFISCDTASTDNQMDHFSQDQFNRFLMQSIVLLCLVWFYQSNSI